MLDWLDEYKAWILAGSAIMFVGTLAAVIVIIARLPADYFRKKPHESGFAKSHPVVRCLLVAGRNVLGALLVVMGAAMLIGPGQGILAILIGIMLLDIPGKRKLELSIVRRRRVLGAINWIRSKANRPPLELPSKQE